MSRAEIVNARRASVALLVVCLALTAGCATRLRNRELEAVAKDWSMVIRASQVIPVYPLTEDLQPGDIFLVQVPIDRQQEIYKRRGFLPLDNRMRRVDPGGYAGFYRKSFAVGEDEKTPVPKHWLKPGEENAWDLAPKATLTGLPVGKGYGVASGFPSGPIEGLSR